MGEVAPDDRWDLPLRLLAALHYLVLSDGADSWRDPVGTVAERSDWIARFVAEQSVQTNEVQRCWALLPAFLTLGDGPLDLLELGPSAGLNLSWDRYRHTYQSGTWGPAESGLMLSGNERAPVPASLLERRPPVVRRRGIDLDPVDVTSDDGARLLECFVWADQTERLARVRLAMDVVRRDPPELVRGDYVELLPAALADRRDGALLVVFQTASTQYLSRERYEKVRDALATAPRPLAWISTRRQDEAEGHSRGSYELELAVWPERGPSFVARMGYHGQWLEWFA